MRRNSAVKTAFSGSMFQNSPYALQGLSSQGRPIYRGMAVRLSDLAKIRRNGFKSADTAGEVWFSTSPNEALDYAFHRGMGQLSGENDQWVLVVFRVERDRLPASVRFSPHVRPDQNPNYLVTNQDIPPDAITHGFVVNPAGAIAGNWFVPLPSR